MSQGWSAYRRASKERFGGFASLGRDVMAGLAKSTGFVARLGQLQPGMHEPMARAVAVTTRHDGCGGVRTHKTAKYGATGK